ncbi:hypothetical protein F5Y03DRAFT_400311 [Xylaria venustula]|nr:hypothetical protein F5Y03DRAFT_400311 [Xylaria venustula]
MILSYGDYLRDLMDSQFVDAGHDPLADIRAISGCECYNILHGIAVVENKHKPELALAALQDAVVASVKGYGYDHCVTAHSIAALEAYLKSKGNL